MTALAYRKGNPVLLVLACKEFHATSISVFVDGESLTSYWSVDLATTQAPPEVTLFTAPSGWTTQSQSLTELRPSTRYGVYTRGGEGHDAISITFALDDLTALPVGQVLVGGSASGRHVESESKFRADAHDACS
jgi:hypothetical protein